MKNKNFVVYNPEGDVEVKPDFEVPNDEVFKDVNASKILPSISRLHVELFCKRYIVRHIKII